MSSAAMNLLLLLSALLSALTGVGASARAPERPRAVAEISVGRQAAVPAPAHVASRRASAPPALAVVAAIGRAVAPLARPARLWIDRRRE